MKAGGRKGRALNEHRFELFMAQFGLDQQSGQILEDSSSESTVIQELLVVGSD